MALRLCDGLPAKKPGRHSVARPHEVEAQLRLSDGEARLSGDTSVSQSAHRIREVSALGGLIKLKDELKFKFDLLGRKEA